MGQPVLGNNFPSFHDGVLGSNSCWEKHESWNVEGSGSGEGNATFDVVGHEFFELVGA